MSDFEFNSETCDDLTKGKVSSPSTASEHVKIEKPRSYSGGLCGKAFRSKHSLQNHIHLHTGETHFKCEFCSESFVTPRRRDHHRVAKHSVFHSCDTCGKTYATKGSVNKHAKTHLVRLVKCDICLKEVRDCNLPQHMNIHNPSHAKRRNSGKSFECNICGKICKQSDQLERHIRTHTTEKPYKCDKCGRHYADDSTLKEHLIARHNLVIDTRHQCVFCGKSFYKRCQLFEHIRLHIQEKPHNCKICGKGYSAPRRPRSLRSHLNYFHGKRKPYKCTLCGKGFSAPYYLKKHAGAHKNDKT